MKKLLLFILTLVYLTATTGASVQLHYCMDKLVAANEDICGKCGMDKQEQKEKNCCKDVNAQVKVDNGHYMVQQLQVLQIALPATPPYSVYSLHSFQDQTVDFPKSNAPPKQNIPIFKRNCVFII